MLFSFGIRNRVAILTKGVTIEAFLSSANFFCYSNPLSSARLSSTSKGTDKNGEYFAMRIETGNGVNNNDTVLETMNKKSTEFVHILDNETTAWHMGGSASQQPERRDEKDDRVITKFRSHKDQWMKETCYEWPSKCSIEDCTNEPTVGAHVVIDGRKNIHLVPLCQSCNLDRRKNFDPDIKESGKIQSRNGFKLETGTPCIELNHISREECLVSYDPISWTEMYDKLVLHVERNNNTSVSYQNDMQVKQWLWRQRLRYKTKTITEEEINLIEALGIVWDPLAENWNKNFALLKQYKHKNGNCNVPQQYEENGVNLGRWLSKQRHNQKKKRMNAEKEKQLEDLGVIWEPRIDQWEENFKLLEEYKQRNGDCNVPYDYEENDINLGEWLSYQRLRYKALRNITSKEINLLEDIGFSWDPAGDSWNNYFALLEQYKHKNGDCNVPRRYEENGVNLGEWLTRQRQNKNKNRLDTKKEKQLEDLGVIWEPKLNQWKEKYELLEQFKIKKGHCNVSGGRKEDRKYRALGKWLTYQRYYYKNGDLRNERLIKLDKLGVEWNLKKK